MSSFIELSEAQRRQLLDAEAVFEALESAEEQAWRHRGSMFWREQAGRKYLIKLSPDSRQRSLGPESEDTHATYQRFTERKADAEHRLKGLREQADTMRRLNRALRVGRTPDVLVDVLNVLGRARVSQHFLVVGTNALHAYETAAGVRLPGDVMETRDADLLFDTRQRAEFLQTMESGRLSFLGLLRKADKTFQRHESEFQTAVNGKGYEIDLLRRSPPTDLEAQEHPMQMTPDEDDLWAVRASMGQRLLSAPRFSQVVVGTSGAMARMTTVHPLAFARIKRQLSRVTGRDPRKAPKDAAQARQVEQLVREFLPHLSDEQADGQAEP